MIKAAIFDLNGIFIQGPRLSDRFKEAFSIETKDFLPVLKEIMAKIRKPNAGSAFSYWKPYLEKWNVNLTEEQFLDFWFGAEKEIPELVELAKQIKIKGVKVFILSNNFAERADYYKKNSPFLTEIPDKIYYSWQTGFVKPDPQAFENLLAENDFKPEECIYFDDLEENIKVANDLGIKAFLYNNAVGLEETLRNNQVI